MKLITLILLALSTTALQAAPKVSKKVNCVSETTPFEWKYCIVETVGSRNRDVLYHFHGRGLNEKTWQDDDYYTEQVRKVWKGYRHHAPVVVSVSFGPFWLLVEKNASPASGLLEVFHQVVMPTVEAKVNRFSGRRLLVGESMGGFNASQVALKLGRHFAKVAMLCPPFVTLSPFSSPEEIEAFIQKTKADPKRVHEMVQASQAFMPTPEDWKNSSPVEVAKTHLNRYSPRLYVSCGLYDEYGFFPGSEVFAAIGQKRGASLQWRPLYGGHCAVDIVSLAVFLR